MQTGRQAADGCLPCLQLGSIAATYIDVIVGRIYLKQRLRSIGVLDQESARGVGPRLEGKAICASSCKCRRTGGS